MLVCKTEEQMNKSFIILNDDWKCCFFFFSFCLQRAVNCHYCECVHSSISIRARGSLLNCNSLFFLLAKEIVQLTTCNENISFFLLGIRLQFCSYHFTFSRAFLLSTYLPITDILFMFSELIFPLQIDFIQCNSFASIVPHFIGTQFRMHLYYNCYHAVNLPHPIDILLCVFPLLMLHNLPRTITFGYNVMMPFCIHIYALKHNDCLFILFSFFRFVLVWVIFIF